MLKHCKNNEATASASSEIVIIVFIYSNFRKFKGR